MAAVALLLAAAVAAAGCEAPRENSVHRAARERHNDRLLLVRERQDRERQRLEAAILEDELILLRLRNDAAFAANRRRQAQRALDYEAAGLARQQRELQEVQQSAAAAATDLEELRAAVAQVHVKELRLQSLREQRQLLDADLAAAEQELQQRTAVLQPQIDALRERIARTGELQAAVEQAMQELGVGTEQQPAADAAAQQGDGQPQK